MFLIPSALVIAGLIAALVGINHRIRNLKAWGLSATTEDIEAAAASKLRAARDLLEPDIHSASPEVQLQFQKINEACKTKGAAAVEHRVRDEDH